MRNRTSAAAEDYLKAIYGLTRGGERASTNAIAERMGVSAASATAMVQKLAGSKPALLEYEKHRGAALTPHGEQAALEVIRHHRLIETFLQQKLGYSWDEVHEEADRLEHVISEQLEERIARSLGDPQVDPHGEPIPSREFSMPERSNACLTDLEPGSQAVVAHIDSNDPELLRYLASIGLTPGSRLAVLERLPFDGNLRLRLGGSVQTCVLGPGVTGRVFITPVEAT